jgi:hypothetical protein
VVRGVAAVVAAVVLVAGGIVGWSVWHGGGHEDTPNDECTATVAGYRTALEPEQARWAGLIVAISVERGMPARAASIALAAAYQESKLYNLHSGDRDSVGLFQQRPSQGWGTKQQILDPVYATNAFFDALERVAGYESMPITDAAQSVQHSGYPEAYAAHEPDARALASALTGNSAHSFSCRLADAGTGGSADAVTRDLTDVFGGQPATATTGGLAVPVPTTVRGWAEAQYLVSQAHHLRLGWVAYGGLTWHSGARSRDGWQPDASTSGTDRIRVGVGG